MIAFLTGLAPLLCGALLAATGAGKLFGRRVASQAAGTVLVRVLGDGRRATAALRTVGGAELAVAALLLSARAPLAAGSATAVLGAGFTAYLGYARVTAPGSSCGCSARDEGPIGARAFARALLVVAGGALAVAGDLAWWSAVARHPVGALALTAGAAVLVAALSDGLDRWWLLPLRRTRLRVFGHPLAGSGGEVPPAASVELLEHSLAWQSAAPVVRSALLDHWDEDGWRILRFAGVYEGDGGTRPVSVLFALDRAATVDTSPVPAVRLSMVDDGTGEVVTAGAAPRTMLPLAD